jgi:predicted XRE-type DNA-binding protein
MVQYAKLMIYRESICLYYANGNGNSYRYNLGIRICDFNEKVKSKIKISIKKNIIPDEILSYKREIQEIFEIVNNEISSFKVKKGRKPTIDEFKNILKSRTTANQEKEEVEEIKFFFIEYLNEFLNHKEIKFIQSQTISSLKDYKSFRNSILDFQLFTKRNLEIF